MRRRIAGQTLRSLIFLRIGLNICCFNVSESIRQVILDLNLTYTLLQRMGMFQLVLPGKQQVPL